MEDRRDVYRVLVERPEEGRSLGRGKLSSDDNILRWCLKKCDGE